jgi:hypothetical protein
MHSVEAKQNKVKDKRKMEKENINNSVKLKKGLKGYFK